MKLIDPGHPFYRPLWRRIAIVAVALGWAVLEAAQGNPGWALVFVAIGAVAGWTLLVAWPGNRGK